MKALSYYLHQFIMSKAIVGLQSLRLIFFFFRDSPLLAIRREIWSRTLVSIHVCPRFLNLKFLALLTDSPGPTHHDNIKCVCMS